VVAIDGNRKHDRLMCHAGCVLMGAPDGPSTAAIAKGASAVSLDRIGTAANRRLVHTWVSLGIGYHLDGIGLFDDAGHVRKSVAGQQEGVVKKQVNA